MNYFDEPNILFFKSNPVVTIGVLVCIIILADLITNLTYQYYKRINFTDIPDDRSLHGSPIVTGGGISIALLNIVGLLYYFPLFAASAIIISILGFIDDKINLSPLIRILFHFSCSYILIICIGGFPELDFGLFEISNVSLLNIIGIIFISWFINLYNFMDGSDGFAALESIFISMALFLLICFNVSLINTDSSGETSFILRLLIINIASCIGFLFLNYPNAKIFMGDLGSNFLGLYIIGISLYIVNSSEISIWTILILYGIFFIDSTTTLIRRFLLKQKWYKPHRSHLYQRFITYKQKNNSRAKAHKNLLIISLFINCLWRSPLAILSVIYSKFSFICFVVSSMPLVYLSVFKYNEEFEIH